MIWLLDGNVLVALCERAHVQHAQAREWFASRSRSFATCPITQGTLLRHLLRQSSVDGPGAALAVLRQVTDLPAHRFWPDQLDYAAISWRGVLGHRQITDAYLAALARHHQGRLATFDGGLATVHADTVELIT